jgi:phosphopantothenoylcysteine decarboxylase/phosphopantothenate--cysteine ligase
VKKKRANGMSPSIVKDKEVVLGITGGIAAYKSAELVRQIIKEGGNVHVIMTRSAQEFISPLTFQTLTGNPVTTELFTLYQEKEIGHIALADRAHILVVSPATANIIGKVAAGIADDILATVIMATKAPVVFAPAMNVMMWENPIVQQNIKHLSKMGYHFIDPEMGELACGFQGKGRLAGLDAIMDEIIAILSPKDFLNQKALVTAGPTQEMLDPIRFISNPSSGKMGFALAKAFKERGAQVTLISGPTSLTPPCKVKFVPIKTAEEMRAAVNQHFKKANIVVKAAAVADLKPKKIAPQKIKKREVKLRLELERTPDILETLGKRKGQKILVGFAAETENTISNAKKKLRHKNLDLVVANKVNEKDIGFASDMNQVYLISGDNNVAALPIQPKDEIAHKILDNIIILQKARST